MYLKQLIIFCTLLYASNGKRLSKGKRPSKIIERQYYFRMKLNSDDGCVYKGYRAGGGVNEADERRIKAPAAELAKNGVMAVLGDSKKAAGIAKQAVGALTAFMGVMEEVSGKLGPALGVFGAATGFIQAFNKVTPHDVVNAVNKAMSQLTHDMNNKLDSMKDYIDSKVIDLQKRLIKDSYDKYFIFWRNCMDEVNIDDIVECQEEAYSYMSAALPEFAIYDDELFKNTYLDDNYKAREIEAYLIAFRDYANLILMMLKPLVQTFENDKSTEGRKQYARYCRYIKEKADFFIKYAKAAVKAIQKAHSTSPCLNTFSCGRRKSVWEGWWHFKVHTVDRRVCTCTMDENTKMLCNVNMVVRTDTDKVYTLKKYSCGRKDYECGTKMFGKEIVTKRTPVYVRRDVKVLTAYWQKNLLDFIPAWRTAFDVIKTSRGDEPLDVLSDEMDVSLDEPKERPGAEERRKARLAKAEKELSMLPL